MANRLPFMAFNRLIKTPPREPTFPPSVFHPETMCCLFRAFKMKDRVKVACVKKAVSEGTQKGRIRTISFPNQACFRVLEVEKSDRIASYRAPVPPQLGMGPQLSHLL